MTSAAPIAIRPVSGRSNPAIIRSVVVLPQPDGPSSEKNSPCRNRQRHVVDGEDVASTDLLTPSSTTPSAVPPAVTAPALASCSRAGAAGPVGGRRGPGRASSRARPRPRRAVVPPRGDDVRRDRAVAASLVDERGEPLHPRAVGLADERAKLGVDPQAAPDLVPQSTVLVERLVRVERGRRGTARPAGRLRRCGRAGLDGLVPALARERERGSHELLPSSRSSSGAAPSTHRPPGDVGHTQAVRSVAHDDTARRLQDVGDAVDCSESVGHQPRILADSGAERYPDRPVSQRVDGQSAEWRGLGGRDRDHSHAPLLRAVVPTLTVLRVDAPRRLSRLRHLQQDVSPGGVRRPRDRVLGAERRRHAVGRGCRANGRDRRTRRRSAHRHAHVP